MPGGTNWGRKPYPAITEIICDGDKKVWRARVITVLYSIVMYIGQPKKKITQGVIDASKCADLAVLFHDLSELIKSDGTDPAQADFWLPPEYVRTHELVHVVHLQEIVNRRYATLVAEIEAITAPCTLSEEDVKKAMADAIEEAQKRYKKGIEDDVIIEKQHIPPKPFIDASIAATQLWLAAVLRKRSELHCP